MLCEGLLDSMMIWYNYFRQKTTRPHQHAANYVMGAMIGITQSILGFF